MDKQRLRRWLLVFFLALLLPAAILIQQSYSRLKWETFHQYQKMAVELSQRIDNRLSRLVAIEDNRTFEDYSYLSGANDKDQPGLRSPLSNYPVESDIPGVLGYFQVDSNGVLTTPLIPPIGSSYSAISQEISQRREVQNQLQQILAANQLVVKELPALAVGDDMRDQSLDIAESIEAEAMSPSTYSSVKGLEADVALGASISADEVVAKRKVIVQKPIAFEKLKERSQEVATKNNYARLEDIELKQNFQQKMDTELRPQPMRQREKIKLSSRGKSAKKQLKALPAVAAKTNQSLRIRTFESAIDPFEFSQLDSGHFVLFRKVWLNGQRYTQGLLIERMAFLSLIQEAFLNTSLSQMSGVLVAYQGNVLANFTETTESYQTKGESLSGEELYQVRLSAPFSDLRMIYSITDLPVGVGGQLILWLSLIMASVLLGGFYMMYRLGVKQINLATQQQDFVSAVSHELKTPLTSIRMYGEILKQGWAPEEKKRRYYDFIYDESERLSRLINNVLQLARMNRNEQAPELSASTVETLVQEIQSKISSQIETAGFKLLIQVDELASDDSISIDRDWLTQVMINLADNAVKFSAKAERKEVILSADLLDKKSVRFTIRDFGPGIDSKHMKAIFELFYRSENELTRDTVGTGIGLSLVHQMVTSMAGKVTVKNGESGDTEFPGAAFSVSFPLLTHDTA